MPVSGPDRCPECGAGPLVPLPVGCCSECGFEYDADTRIWRPRRSWHIYLLFANTLLFSPWLYRLLEVTIRYHQWPSASVLFGGLVSAGSLAWALPRLRVVLAEGHRYVAITPRGIQARTPKNRYFIPWDDLADVSVVLGVPRLRRRREDATCLLEWIFDSDQEVAAFVDAVRAARQRYQSAEGGGDDWVEQDPAV